MSSNPVADIDLALNDLGPLAWVLDELRKSLDGATKALRRFVRDAELARGSELGELDASQLRIARQQLHQAVGALEMVGLSAPAKVLRAMESLAQKYVQRPELCSDDAAAKMERASFALSEFLEGVLKGKKASAVALFPQYRAVMELIGSERVHPADLWISDWRWLEVPLDSRVSPKSYSPAVRAKLDQLVLRMVKSDDLAAAARLGEICAGLSAGQTALEPRTFWTICSAFFQACALQLCPLDVFTKRAASRVLQQYAGLARREPAVSERLAQDLLFFCSLSVPTAGLPIPALRAVRDAYGLVRDQSVDYQTEQFGRFDPALLVLARKRIASATETWSALAGGDTNRLKMAVEQFAAVCESIVRLHPESSELAQALTQAIDAVQRSGAAPVPSVAMEVATAILYLEAAYEDLDPTNSQMALRSARLAQRLDHVTAGGEPEPMEGWMEDLYRRVSDRQTMGSVVDELRMTLAEVEKSLDQFFRQPHDKSPLREVPSQLAQMRGVFSVLGLDQPSLAALRMRTSVEQFLVDEIDEATARTGIFEKLGNSLGAMGFLIDMLSYQRALAKKLFVYDESAGEFKPLMGRERLPEAPALVPEITLATPSVLPAVAPAAVSGAKPVLLQPTAVPTSASEDANEEEELIDIFLEEAREVIHNGSQAVNALVQDPTNLAEQTTLRRAFHTLKGSSRMVGLTDFGEAAWSFEQLLNTRLAEQKPASDDLVKLTASAMQAFGRWVDDIARQRPDIPWNAQDFRKSSDAMRLENRYLPLQTPPAGSIAARPADAASFQIDAPDTAADFAHAEFLPTQVFGEAPDASWQPQPSAQDEALPLLEFENFDADAGPETVLPDYSATVELNFEKTTVLRASDTQTAPDTEPSALAPLGADDFDFSAIAEMVPDTSADSLSSSTEPSALAPLDGASGPDFDFAAEHALDTSPDSLLPNTEPSALAPLDGAPDNVYPASVAEAPAPAEDPVKVIGNLRLGIPLYNVYLNEADEWSRRLQTELSEWALELHRTLPDSVVSLAHSLGGSSATVGFGALSEMARTLEQALQHVRLHRQGQPPHAHVFARAAEDIRRLLHQFAAGFLKDADQDILAALHAIIATEFPAPTIDEDAEGIDFDDDLDSLPTQMPDYELSALATDADLVAATGAAGDGGRQTPANDLMPDVVSTQPPVEVAPELRAAPLKVAQSHHDDIDAVDHLDPDLYPIFEEEAGELLPHLGSALRQWVAHPEHLPARSEALRILHTLKGSARLAGAMRLGEMAHRMESSIEDIGTEALQAVQLEPLLTAFDALQATFDALGAKPALQALVEPVDAPDQSAAVAVSASPAAALVPSPGRPGTNQSVRVRSQLLDRLVNQAGEVMITRSRMDARLNQLRSSLGELGGNLERLRGQLRDVELQAETQMQSRLAQTKDASQNFDPLEFDRFTRVQELTRMMAESVNDVATVQRNLQRSIEAAEDDLIAQGRQARELQRDLLRTRMVEFEGISERLYGVVRQAAKDTGKQVKLDIVGGSLDMDRGVLERMAPAFEHLLRNAVAHGIEDAAVRVATGKPAIGTITITLNQESNDISVTFSDDGAGLQLDRIRAKALAGGLIQPDTVLTESDAANLVFMPGFTTADHVTELAGRGIGMDVVRSEVSALGGRIETSTVAGKGTTFKLVLPLTTAVTQVVMLRMGEFTIGVPSGLMETTLRVTPEVLQHAYEREAFEFADSTVPFFWAGALLQVSAHSHELHAKTLPVAVFRSAGQRMALHVDEVLGNREVVVKHLGPQLARLPGLAGMSVLASGAVVLIYNPVALATVYGEQARALRRSGADASPPATGLTPGSVLEDLPLVLVVDDSITVRRVTQRLLKREGYRVALANDGLQALERLQEEKPAVVLSDIEMPRMDGFDLVRNIRADARLRDLPIIMITSRIAEKHREHARELGVDHYLGKPYSEDELLALVRGYCAVAVAA
jgi:chemosensory pili system protein ChpA (sensor histidine kinase/response regulator)